MTWFGQLIPPVLGRGADREEGTNPKPKGFTVLWTLRRKLLAISLLAITFLVAVGGTGLWGAAQATSASQRQQQLSSLLTQQLDGELAHNGASRDVWEALAITNAA